MFEHRQISALWGRTKDYCNRKQACSNKHNPVVKWLLDVNSRAAQRATHDEADGLAFVSENFQSKHWKWPIQNRRAVSRETDRNIQFRLLHIRDLWSTEDCCYDGEINTERYCIRIRRSDGWGKKLCGTSVRDPVGTRLFGGTRRSWQANITMELRR